MGGSGERIGDRRHENDTATDEFKKASGILLWSQTIDVRPQKTSLGPVSFSSIEPLIFKFKFYQSNHEGVIIYAMHVEG